MKLDRNFCHLSTANIKKDKKKKRGVDLKSDVSVSPVKIKQLCTLIGSKFKGTDFFFRTLLLFPGIFKQYLRA